MMSALPTPPEGLAEILRELLALSHPREGASEGEAIAENNPGESGSGCDERQPC